MTAISVLPVYSCSGGGTSPKKNLKMSQLNGFLNEKGEIFRKRVEMIEYHMKYHLSLGPYSQPFVTPIRRLQSMY